MREIEAIEGDYNLLKDKFEATKARNTVLTNEIKTSKEQVKTLLEKAKHDDELVAALLVRLLSTFSFAWPLMKPEFSLFKSKQSQYKETVEKLQSQNDKYAKDLAEKTIEVSFGSSLS